MRGYEILTTAAARADPERAVAMLAEAAVACFAAGKPAEMLAAAERAHAALSDDASVRSRFIAETALGMARVLGGDAAAGAEALHRGITLAAGAPELKDDLQLLPWLTLGPIFLRKADVGRLALAQALETARARAALGELPFVLFLLARDQATSDRWAVAEATYEEAIGIARETDQGTDLGFGLAGLAWLQARRGRVQETRRWPPRRSRWPSSSERGCTRCGRPPRSASSSSVSATPRGPPSISRISAGWCASSGSPTSIFSRGRARRRLRPARPRQRREAGRGPVHDRRGGQGAAVVTRPRAALPRAGGRRRRLCAEQFERALRLHAHTPDEFETARTRLAFGQRLRRGRNRVLAREQLRAAVDAFERLDARPWAEQARTELAATGETCGDATPARSTS